MPNPNPKTFYVDYKFFTKMGTPSRAQFSTGLSQISGAQSESAVLSYLRKKHPDSREIIIMKLEWK